MLGQKLFGSFASFELWRGRPSDQSARHNLSNIVIILRSLSQGNFYTKLCQGSGEKGDDPGLTFYLVHIVPVQAGVPCFPTEVDMVPQGLDGFLYPEI
eukprot:6453585-Ditylum_brightwellii.AAC.1